jgi:hypothetical protein
MQMPTNSMKRFVSSQILAVVFLAACGLIPHTGKIRGSDLTDIQLGMTKAEVVEKLGKPVNASANETFEVYRYFEDRGRYILVYHDFVFVNGKLKLFGLSDAPDFKAKFEVITSQH